MEFPASSTLQKTILSKTTIAILAAACIFTPSSSVPAKETGKEADVTIEGTQSTGEAGSAEAQAPASLEEQLYFGREELVTGPGRREMKLSEAPANVTVVTHEDIIQSGAHSLAEVFRRVPGMGVVSITSNETQVSMRGFAGPIAGGQRIAVLIDGRTFYHEFLNGTIWEQIPVPLSDIKRVELIKGPMSALYGNKAMLGIINIVTYDPEETRTELMGGGGQYYLGTADFRNAGKFAENYWYKVTGHYLRLNQFSGIPNFNTNKSEETFSATGKFLAEPTDNTRASLMAGITQDFGLVDFGGIVGGDERRSVVDAKISHDFGKFGKLDYQSYWERHYMSSKNLPALGTVIVDNVDAILQYSFAFDISADVRNTMTYGAEYRFANLIDRSVRSINNYAGFLQDEFRFFDWVILTGGMRADYQQNFAGLNISANGSTVFLIHPRYTLRLGFGSAFNTPNYIHYYAGILQPLLAASTGTIVGNRNLHAERVLYLDVGNTIVPIDGVTVRADFFYYRLNDLIVPQLAFAATGPVASFINDGGAAGVGGEIGITGEVSSWLEGYANWSYEHFTPINNNFNSTPNLGNPRNKAGAGLRGYWFGRRLTANIDFNYTQSHQFQAGVINFPITPLANVNSFYLLNARVAYWPIRDHLEIAVAANNILNNNSYQVPPFDSRFNLVLAERPRFNIWGSVRYQF